MLLNHPRALALMRQSGIDALVATSPVNVLYIGDYFCWLDPLFKAYMTRPGASADLNHNFAVLPADGQPALVLPAMWAANAAESWIADVWTHGSGEFDFSALPAVDSALLDRVRRGAGHTDAIDALCAVLHDRGLAHARIGIELEGLPPAVREQLIEKLPAADLLDCSNFLRLIRAVKSTEELRRLERSARINVATATEVLLRARAGTTLRALQREYIRTVTETGARLDHFIAAPQGTGLWQVPDYTLREHDVLYVDFGCIFEHYYSDNGATLVLDELPGELAQRYDVLRAALERGVRELRPRQRASAVHAAMHAELAAGGITDCNAHGHGVGLEVRDYPIIMPDEGRRIRDDCIDVTADVTLEPGMVVNLETPLYLFGAASLHIEQTFVVTSDGCRRIDGDGATESIRVGQPALTAS